MSTAADTFGEIDRLAGEVQRRLERRSYDKVVRDYLLGIQAKAQDSLRDALANQPTLAAFDELLAAVNSLAYTLNSTPESGPICWCDPNGPAGHTDACDRMRAAIAKVERQSAPDAEAPGACAPKR